LKVAFILGIERKQRLMTVRASRPTVCQVLHSLRIGGAEVLAAKLARLLEAHFRVVFVCLDELGELGEQLRRDGFAVEVLGRRSGWDWRCTWRLASFLRRRRVDLIHAHQYTPFFYALTARLLYHGPPILFMEHGRHFPDFPRRKRILFNRLLLERRDRIVGVGEAVRQALIHNEGIPPARVSVIYNGIDLAKYSWLCLDRVGMRKELKLDANDFVIIQVARMDYLKDHATALRTAKRVASVNPNVRLVLVGEGPELEKVQELAQRLDLTGITRFLGVRKDVDRLLPAADMFLLTSISEGIPLTVIEAMAAALPVVATRVGGMGEVVIEGTTGFLAPAGDDAMLADRILHIVNNPEVRMRLGQAGSTRAQEMFSQEQMVAGYVRLFHEQLGR
jgi:glycosyltransferase involved in cell wall biosynthesis